MSPLLPADVVQLGRLHCLSSLGKLGKEGKEGTIGKYPNAFGRLGREMECVM